MSSKENDTGSVLFVGLGNMGWPMASNLARSGRRVVVSDADADREVAFTAEYGGASYRTSSHIDDVAAVVLMLPTSKIVHDALLGAGGIAGRIPDSCVIVDMSSSDPTDTLSLAETLSARGISVVDAPVSGGVVRAQQGTLAIMMGADDESSASVASEVVAPMSDRVFRTGKVGSGHAMKALNNYVAAAAFAASAEAAIVGERFGLTVDVVTEVLNASTGRSFMSETTMRKIVNDEYTTGFALGLLNKDVDIAVRLAEESGKPAPVCAAVSRRFNSATAELGFGVDHSRAFDSWKNATG